VYCEYTYVDDTEGHYKPGLQNIIGVALRLRFRDIGLFTKTVPDIVFYWTVSRY